MIKDDGYYEIELRNGEIDDLRVSVKVEYNEPWQAWQVGYTDEDGEYVFALVRDAKTKEEAQLVGINEVKEHGFIRNQLWIE
jgi:hypothetical protein